MSKYTVYARIVVGVVINAAYLVYNTLNYVTVLACGSLWIKE